MAVREVEAKSILNKHKRIDSWFLSRYGMNIYRGCAHDCSYCDGRAERYGVEGDFGRDVIVKTNAPDLLCKAFDPRRKRTPLKRSYIALGGGVGDSYQPIEGEYGLTRKVLQVIEQSRFPVHVLTKSCLVERDLDLLKKIDEHDQVIVSMSFSSSDDELSRLFEPGCPPPSKRLQTLARLSKHGIATGMLLLPVIPLVTDTAAMIDETVSKAKEAGADFVLFGGLTLKEGRQKRHFLDAVCRFDPALAPRIQRLYGSDRWGQARPGTYEAISYKFYEAARTHKVACRMPSRLFRHVLDENDRVVVVLEGLDHLLRLQGRGSPFCISARSVAQLKEPISGMRNRLSELKGVGRTTERIIQEILETGTCSYYESLLQWRDGS